MPTSEETVLDLMESDILIDLRNDLTPQSEYRGVGEYFAPSDESDSADAFSESGAAQLEEKLGSPVEESQYDSRTDNGSDAGSTSLNETAADTAQEPSDHTPIVPAPIAFCKSLAYLQILSTSGKCTGYAAASCTVCSAIIHIVLGSMFCRS